MTAERIARPARLLAGGVAMLALAAACVFGTTDQQRKQAEIDYDLGVAEMRSGRIREAMNFFLQSVEVNPEFAQAQNGLGLALHFLGKNEKAIEHFKKALEIKEDYPEVRNNMARVYISMNRYREAIPILEKALDNVFLSERYLAESNLGWALFQVGQEAKGMKLVMSALSKNEGYCVGYEYLGLMYKKQKNYDQAIHEFEQLIEKCPTYPSGQLNQGKLHLMVGKIDLGCSFLGSCKGMGRMSPVGQECDRLFRASCPREAKQDSP